MSKEKIVYHCIFNRKVKICDKSEIKTLKLQGYFIKEVYFGPSWNPATYFYLGKNNNE